MKRILPVVLAVSLFVVTAVMATQASALTLDKIGTTNFTSGATTWIHYGENPVFQGTATASAVVDLSLDGATEASATADTNGDWSITPTSLDTNGDYQVLLSSGAESIDFTLTIASASATESSTTTSTTSGLPETLPKSGSEDISFLLTIGGVMLLAAISSRLLLQQN